MFLPWGPEGSQSAPGCGTRCECGTGWESRTRVRAGAGRGGLQIRSAGQDAGPALRERDQGVRGGMEAGLKFSPAQGSNLYI